MQVAISEPPPFMCSTTRAAHATRASSVMPDESSTRSARMVHTYTCAASLDRMDAQSIRGKGENVTNAGHVINSEWVA